MNDKYFPGNAISLWILEKDSGLPIIAMNFKEDEMVDSSLLGAYMTAMKSMMSDIQIGELSAFQTNKASIILLSSEELTSIIALEKDSDVKQWYPILQNVHEIIEKTYQEYKKLSSLIESSIFDQKRKELRSLILDHSKEIKEPKKEKNPSDGERIREALKKL